MSSKRRGTDPKLATVFKILRKFMAMNQCAPFLKPVIELHPSCKHDYLSQIKKPMDFGTIAANYSSGEYKSALLMISDIQLVFKNCIEFNEQSSRAFADQARELEKIFARDLKKEGLSTFGDSNVTDAQKKDFSRMIYNITTVDLGQIVSVLDNRCPQCLTHNSNEVELDIDLIDPETFRQVESIAKEKQLDSIAVSRAKSSKKRKAGQ